MSIEEKYQSHSEIAILARELMDKHGLESWRFSFDNSKRRVGYCQYSRKTISLSKSVSVSCTKALVKDTILHEIAHALVGPGHGHDWVWQRKCIEIGGSGQRMADASEIEQDKLNFAYKGTCPNGHVTYRSKKPREGMIQSCGRCSRRFDRRYIITWEKQ